MPFRFTFRGTILLPGEPGFKEQQGKLHNAQGHSIEPAVSFIVGGLSDVVAAVKLCKQLGVGIKVSKYIVSLW